MKTSTLFFGAFTAVAMIILISCQHSNQDALIGQWKVSTQAFQAVYQIQPGESGYDCQVVSYNDGTKRYSKESKKRPFVFKNIDLQQASQIDGSSGATKSRGSVSNSHKIRVINENQLEVVSTIMNQKKVELWTRVQ